MPLAKAATQKAMSTAGRSWYLVELRNRSRDSFDNLGPLRGERELSRRLALCSCSRALVERRYLLRPRVLLSTVAVQAHEREEVVRLSVFRFAVGEAGKPSKPPPIRRAGVSIVPLRQCLSGKGSEELRKRSRMLEQA
jgi:hypothetical protein